MNNYDPNNSKNFSKLKKIEKEILLKWIVETIKPAKNYCHQISSYGLKQLFEENPGKHFYINNGTFKGAMKKASFRTKDEKDPQAINWKYRIEWKLLKKLQKEIYGRP